MMYLARCKKGLVVAGSIANTPMEQADSAKEVKAWTKKGYNVTLEEPKESPKWCLQGTRCKDCTLEDV